VSPAWFWSSLAEAHFELSFSRSSIKASRIVSTNPLLTLVALHLLVAESFWGTTLPALCACSCNDFLPFPVDRKIRLFPDIWDRRKSLSRARPRSDARGGRSRGESGSCSTRSGQRYCWRSPSWKRAIVQADLASGIEEDLISGETIPRIGIRRFESFCEFCGRARRFESQNQGFESLLRGKKHPKLLKIVQNWATFSMSLRWQLPTKNICHLERVYSNF
jgi:hypothetical protein